MGAWLTAAVNLNCCMSLEYTGVDRCCTALWKLASSSGLTSSWLSSKFCHLLTDFPPGCTAQQKSTDYKGRLEGPTAVVWIRLASYITVKDVQLGTCKA